MARLEGPMWSKKICEHSGTHEVDHSMLWWDYVCWFVEYCFIVSPGQFANEDCIERAYELAGVHKAGIDSCMEHSLTNQTAKVLLTLNWCRKLSRILRELCIAMRYVPLTKTMLQVIYSSYPLLPLILNSCLARRAFGDGWRLAYLDGQVHSWLTSNWAPNVNTNAHILAVSPLRRKTKAPEHPP